MSDRQVFISEDVADVLRLYDGLIGEEAWERSARTQIELLGRRLLEGHRARARGAAVELRNWLPAAGGISEDDVFDRSLSSNDALEAVARSHGFTTWHEVERTGDARRPNAAFERAVELVLAGDREGLAAALDRTPSLVSARSHYGHEATLLHYLTANGVETYRQRIPKVAARVATLLIERGADPNAEARMYGTVHSVRSLLVTSGHPADAGVTADILGVLDGAGAA
ncbi:MAG: hypothetical protein KY475_02075 [Planctomycetes bacterium]|nr:hypothetical protein [Planctomycetota bacterium]